MRIAGIIACPKLDCPDVQWSEFLEYIFER